MATSTDSFPAHPSIAATRGVVSPTQPNWAEFHDSFMELKREEEDIARAERRDLLLRADVRFGRPLAFGDNGGEFLPIEERRCGYWKIYDGPSELFKARFKALATRAGIALGAPADVTPQDFWLHSVFSYLIAHRSPQLLGWADKDKGGTIDRLTDGSAMYCAWLERQELELAHTAQFVEIQAEAVRSVAGGDAASSPIRRRRGPDLETSRNRVALEDKLREELATIQDRSGGYATVDGLKREFPKFRLWEILSEKEQQELLCEEFRPTVYARSLVARKYGLTNPETIKKDRQKLRHHST